DEGWRTEHVVRRRSRARLDFLHLYRGKLAADRKIVVVEHQRARYAIFVDFELDRIGRRLIANACLVEKTHRHRPALQPRKRRLPAGRISWPTLVRKDHVTDNAEGLIDFLPLIRSVV